MKISIANAVTYLFLIITTCYLVNECAAQKSKWVLKIYDQSIKSPLYGRSMEYKFPDSVQKHINIFLKSNKNKRNYIILKFSGDTTELIIYSANNVKIDSTNEVEILLGSTNRHYVFNKLKIPIVFDNDFRFSFPSFVCTHYSFRIVFIAKRWDDDAHILKEDYDNFILSPTP
ncbi:MAG: hypothetical protein HXX18_06950 [Bacteroidetes bacterium]|nr:hypothetical protein [Bacteroidota bacterium]